MALVVKNPSASAGDAGSIAGSGRFPGGANGNPLQYSWSTLGFWRILWQRELGVLYSIELQRVRQLKRLSRHAHTLTSALKVRAFKTEAPGKSTKAARVKQQ